MAGGVQQSSAQSTRNGIHALESADRGVARCRQDVEATKNNLSVAFRGDDGAEYGMLLRQWDDQCAVIQKNLQDMVEALNQSMKQHQQTQTAAGEAISRAAASQNAIFQQLNPS
jgi:uncharacterized protein YukE